jgi:predicted nucleic acid-binding protein
MTGRILVDSNVLLDIITQDPHWSEWSSAQLSESLRRHGRLVINPIVFAEIAFAFETIEVVNDILLPADYDYASIPREAAFLAARCQAHYRASGGSRAMILPDFLIGAHAVVDRMTLLTRDVRRYRTYFPGLRLMAPTASPDECG